jgi:hypothetical protein
MIFRQKKIKKKKEKIYQVLKIIIFWVDFVPQSQHPSHIIPNYMCHPERKMSSQTLNVIPNAALLRTHLLRRMIRDLIFFITSLFSIGNINKEIINEDSRQKCLLTVDVIPRSEGQETITVKKVIILKHYSYSNVKNVIFFKRNSINE